MTSPARLGDYLSLTFSSVAADALACVNEMASQLRLIPDKLITPELMVDRRRLLEIYLPDLLAAHRDARLIAGMGNGTEADAELADGLKHVAKEAERILDACRANANQTLAARSLFLETRYPVTNDALSLAATLEKPASDHAPSATSPHQLTKDSLEALFSEPATAVGNASDLERSTPRRKFWRVSSWNLNSDHMAWPAMLITGLIAGTVLAFHQEHQRTEESQFHEKIKVAVKIDSLSREVTHLAAPKHDQTLALVNLSGSVENRSSLNVETLQVAVDLFSCPTSTSPLSACKPIGEIPALPIIAPDFPAGQTTQFKDEARTEIPEANGVLRGEVRVVSATPREPFDPFDAFGLAP